MKVLIDVEVDYKSNRNKLIVYLNGRSMIYVENKIFEEGDEIIVLTSDEINNPLYARMWDYHCSTNYLILKDDAKYITEEQLNICRKYFNYAIDVLDWTSKQNIDREPCSLGINTEMSKYRIDSYSNRIILDSKLIHIIVKIEDYEVVDYIFASGTPLDLIDRIKKETIGLPCIYMTGPNAEVPISLILSSSENKFYRI